RRCGWFDATVVRYAVRVNGLTGLAVTKLDVLDSFDQIQIATAYDIDSAQFNSVFPYDLGLLDRARPQYETLPGWQTSIAEARTLTDLPRNARAYLDRIQEITEVPIAFVSIGTKREEIIRLS
ncbi:MAG: adenylosuccinate synthetase, partial [Pseudomonas sp.]